MNEEALEHRPLPQTMANTLAGPEFWYENFQNWRRKFLSIRFLLVLGNYLRELDRGGRRLWPLSKPRPDTILVSKPY